MSKFIRSTKALEFENPDGGERFRVAREYLGYVPDWVTETPLFQLASSGSSPVITMVGSETGAATRPSPGVSEEEQALRAKGKALKIRNAAKLPLEELVLAIHELEQRPVGEPDTSGEGASENAPNPAGNDTEQKKEK